MVPFLNVMRPLGPLWSDDSPVNDIGERRSSLPGVCFVYGPPVGRFEEQESEKHWLLFAITIT
jgi:hypothetical protein